MKLGAGHPMGPIELADYVGLDTHYFIVKGSEICVYIFIAFALITLTFSIIRVGLQSPIYTVIY